MQSDEYSYRNRFILRFLAQHPEGVFARDAHEAAASALVLSEEDRSEMLPSGYQPIYKNRAGWAHDRLKRAGYSSSPKRGFWQLTPEGISFAAANPATLSEEIIGNIARSYIDVRLRPVSEEVLDDIQIITDHSSTESPDDRLESAVAELRSSVAAELLQILASVSPTYFETIVLDLLHRMGYGANRNDLQRVGGTGDGGIDGIISLDRLGLEKVYVQAKRWQSNIGSPELQAFYGALAGQHARKGVFITTSSFTPQAVAFAKPVEGIVLIDGPRLAELMIDHETGVTLRPVKVPKLDSDYFDE
ncbi:MAG: restriction endonuclease [Acidobacteriota bacterium]|nr:MAG: restriction endonuclease [Acidobacteriota bacterium]